MMVVIFKYSNSYYVLLGIHADLLIFIYSEVPLLYLLFFFVGSYPKPLQFVYGTIQSGFLHHWVYHVICQGLPVSYIFYLFIYLISFLINLLEYGVNY